MELPGNILKYHLQQTDCALLLLLLKVTQKYNFYFSLLIFQQWLIALEGQGKLMKLWLLLYCSVILHGSTKTLVWGWFRFAWLLISFCIGFTFSLGGLQLTDRLLFGDTGLITTLFGGWFGFSWLLISFCLFLNWLYLQFRRFTVNWQILSIFYFKNHICFQNRGGGLEFLRLLALSMQLERVGTNSEILSLLLISEPGFSFSWGGRESLGHPLFDLLSIASSFGGDECWSSSEVFKFDSDFRIGGLPVEALFIAIDPQFWI